jgi:hypothetical protein
LSGGWVQKLLKQGAGIRSEEAEPFQQLIAGLAKGRSDRVGPGGQQPLAVALARIRFAPPADENLDGRKPRPEALAQVTRLRQPVGGKRGDKEDGRLLLGGESAATMGRTAAPIR